MNRKRKHGDYDCERVTKPITLEEAKALTCGKLIYQIWHLFDEKDNIIGKSMIFTENFFETGKPEEQAKRWSLLMFDDGRLMIVEW